MGPWLLWAKARWDKGSAHVSGLVRRSRRKEARKTRPKGGQIPVSAGTRPLGSCSNRKARKSRAISGPSAKEVAKNDSGQKAAEKSNCHRRRGGCPDLGTRACHRSGNPSRRLRSEGVPLPGSLALAEEVKERNEAGEDLISRTSRMLCPTCPQAQDREGVPYRQFPDYRSAYVEHMWTGHRPSHLQAGAEPHAGGVRLSLGRIPADIRAADWNGYPRQGPSGRCCCGS